MRHLPPFAGLRSTERVEGATGVARGAPSIRLIATGIIRTSQAQKASRRRRDHLLYLSLFVTCPISRFTISILFGSTLKVRNLNIEIRTKYIGV